MDLVINLILNIRLVNLEIDQMQELSHEILLNCLEIQHLQTKILDSGILMKNLQGHFIVFHLLKMMAHYGIGVVRQIRDQIH